MGRRATRRDAVGALRILYVAFGHRSTPEKLDDRVGGYPFEALFVGFIVFESKD